MNTAIQVIAGALACVVYVLAARRAGPGREPKVYAVGLVLAALVYVGFAAAGGAARRWWVLESVGLVLFSAAALLVTRRNVWALALGWAAHAAWDFLLHGPADAAFVPGWYPAVCAGFDLALALYLGVRGTPGVRD